MWQRVLHLFRRPVRAAAHVDDPVAELFKLGAVLLLVIVALIAIVSRPTQNVFTSLARLGEDVLPNFAALLLTYLIASTILERRGVSPEQRMLSRIINGVTASVKPVAGIKDLYPLTSETPYGEAFLNATKVELVGRAFNETLMRHPDELRAFFQAGGQLELVLMDVEDRATVDIAARQYAGQPVVGGPNVDAVVFKATNTIVALHRACARAGVKFDDCVAVHVHPATMNYWGLRFRGPEGVDDLYFAPYDNFRVQTLACPTVVYDLSLSEETLTFWEAEFAAFKEGSLPLREWAVRQTCEDIRRALATGDPKAEPLKLDFVWTYAEEALTEEEFHLAESELVDSTGHRNMTWQHATGSCLQVLVGRENQIIRTKWVPASTASPPAESPLA